VAGCCEHGKETSFRKVQGIFLILELLVFQRVCSVVLVFQRLYSVVLVFQRLLRGFSFSKTVLRGVSFSKTAPWC
jgi:hypothetical protein